MKKRLLALLLCAVMLMAAMPAALAEDTQDIIPISYVWPFDDVDMDSPYYDAVAFVYDSGVMLGIDEDEFDPDANMTRGMFVTTLGRYYGLDIESYSGPSFDDVALDAYYAPYVSWAAEGAVVLGVGHNLFDPTGFITREQMYVIFARYGEAVAGMTFPEDAEVITFADDADISDWARDAIDKMQAAGVLKAEAGDSLKPHEHVTRAEVAETFLAFDAAALVASGTGTVLEFTQYLFFGELDAMYDMTSADVKTEIDARGGMEEFYAQIIAVTGELMTYGDITYIGPTMGFDIYNVEILCGNGPYSLLVMLNSEGEVNGFQVTLSEESIDPPRALPEGFIADEIVVDAGTGYPLGGTVVRPEKADTLLPAVLLVPGSGALARDQIAGVNRIFDQLAAGLAERGIISLRFDKRTSQYPQVAQELDFTVQQEYVEDVLAAVELLGQQPGVDPDKIYIMGHSQGGMLAPMLVDAGADAAGMIFLAGSPRNFMDIADDQLKDNANYYEELGMAEMRDMVNEAAADFRASRALLEKMTEAEAKASELDLYGYNAYYMYTFGQYDAIATIKKLAIPTLILQGSNDRQVYADVDYEIYKTQLAGESYASFRLYEGLGHCFFPSTAGSLMESTSDYFTSHDIPEQIFDDVAEWIGAYRFIRR